MLTGALTPLVLVVDDDPSVRALCSTTLEPAYRVVLAENGRHALRQLYQHRPDLVLLDVSLPLMDGWETCRRIRELTDTPVIMLAPHGAGQDRARGAQGGASDECVAKPFSSAHLLARVRAAIGRLPHARTPRPGAEPPRLSFDNGQLVIDVARRLAIVRGRAVALSATEYRLLETLGRHAGQVLSREQILAQVWGAAYVGETGYVKTYVGLLRQKIEADPRRPVYILARRGLGYYLERRGTSGPQPALEP